MDFITRIFFLIVIIPSAIIHEFSHGYVAEKLGDPTARLAGRLTLNPKAHIDLWGTIILPLMLFLTTGFIFAYAKPVPYNPYNLRNMRWGSALVGAAGPLSNLLLAFVFSLLNSFFQNAQGVFFDNLSGLIMIIIYANVVLAVFNLVPIPPLDGSKVLFALIPDRYEHIRFTLERYGFAILIFFIFFASGIISPVIKFVFSLFVSGFGLFT